MSKERKGFIVFDDELRKVGWSPDDVLELKKELGNLRYFLPRNRDIVLAVEDGRTEFWSRPENLTRVEQVLTHLGESKLVMSCADVAQLKSLQEKGVAFFLRHFGDVDLFALRGVKDGENVPVLKVVANRLVIHYLFPGYELDVRSRILRIV